MGKLSILINLISILMIFYLLMVSIHLLSPITYRNTKLFGWVVSLWRLKHDLINFLFNSIFVKEMKIKILFCKKGWNVFMVYEWSGTCLLWGFSSIPHFLLCGFLHFFHFCLLFFEERTNGEGYCIWCWEKNTLCFMEIWKKNNC